MLNKMIHWALASRALVIGAAVILMVMGLKTATELPVEAVASFDEDFGKFQDVIWHRPKT